MARPTIPTDTCTASALTTSLLLLLLLLAETQFIQFHLSIQSTPSQSPIIAVDALPSSRQYILCSIFIIDYSR
jgi:hypothetical protein